MFRGKDFDPFSLTQPVDDWFKAPFGIEETVKALETWKKSTSKVLFGEVPAERKGERWTKAAGRLFLDEYEGMVIPPKG